MEMLQKLEIMYEYARSNGYCKNRKTLAELMGTTESAISRAFSGGSLSTKFLLRVNEAIGGVFSPAWILYDQGDMFARSAPAQPEQEVSVSTHQPVQEVIVSSDPKRVELLESLVKTLQHEVDLLERYNNHLEEENEALKNANTYVYVRAKDA